MSALEYMALGCSWFYFCILWVFVLLTSASVVWGAYRLLILILRPIFRDLLEMQRGIKWLIPLALILSGCKTIEPTKDRQPFTQKPPSDVRICRDTNAQTGPVIYYQNSWGVFTNTPQCLK